MWVWVRLYCVADHAVWIIQGLNGLRGQGAPYRSALRVIAEKFLKRQIQAGSHDSADDARAAMDLTLLKIRRANSLGEQFV